jgi:hypothetical protein
LEVIQAVPASVDAKLDPVKGKLASVAALAGEPTMESEAEAASKATAATDRALIERQQVAMK